MKRVISFSAVGLAVGLCSSILPANAQVNVTQYHNDSKREGLYIDSAFTQSAAANLTRDLNFNGTIVGNVYAQPLYIEGGPNGPMVIAVTESNNVYALNAANGSIVWQRNVGAPVPEPDLPCTEVGSMGIIGTPVVDLNSRALFLNAMTTPDGGETIKHYILSLNVDTGAINSGWPVDVELMAAVQRHDLHCSDPTATTGTSHRWQRFFMSGMGAWAIATFIMAGWWACQ